MAKLVEYKVSSGSDNMRIDSELLEEAIKLQYKEPIIRFYGWSPACVSFGRNQKDENINIDFCRENNIDTVRRVTGGRALLHDDELTYSFICPFDYLNGGESIIKSYKEISSAIIEGFKILGIELNLGGKKKVNASFEYCMSISTGADLCYGDKKLIGSAQFRKQNYLLQHGSVLFCYNPELIEKIFNEKPISDITFINEINPTLSRFDVEKAMIEGFKKYFKFSLDQI